MSRPINVSTDVYAAIWARRQDGEETEDAILRRIFGCANTAISNGIPSLSVGAGGVFDARNNVQFVEGFEIFRTYRHTEYKAKATGGAWLREDNGKRYLTLNQLNSSIAAGAENVWNGNWKFRNANGTIQSINDLRQ